MTDLTALANARQRLAVRDAEEALARDDAYWKSINESIEDLRRRARLIDESADRILAQLRAEREK